MRILLGIVYSQDGKTKAGEIVWHSDESHIINHPSGDGTTLKPHEYIDWLRADSERREKAGWHILSKVADDAEPITYWQRLVNHTASPEGDTALKAVLSQEIKANE